MRAGNGDIVRHTVMTNATTRFVRPALLAGVLAFCVALISSGSATAQHRPPPVASSATGAEPLTRAPRAAVTMRPFSAIVDGARVVRPSMDAVRAGESHGPGVVEALVVTLAPRKTAADEPDLGSLDDFLPAALCRDLLRLRAQVQEARRVLFGRRGIVRLGNVESDEEASRLRLNLQYSPDPGIRFTLVTP